MFILVFCFICVHFFLNVCTRFYLTCVHFFAICLYTFLALCMLQLCTPLSTCCPVRRMWIWRVYESTDLLMYMFMKGCVYRDVHLFMEANIYLCMWYSSLKSLWMGRELLKRKKCYANVCYLISNAWWVWSQIWAIFKFYEYSHFMNNDFS